jgi:4-amino-4-deoxychorismate lyase
VESTLRAGAGAPGFCLIETMRLLPDGSVPRLALHAARMVRGAVALGWRFDAAGFAAAVAGCDPAAGGRLRLTLSSDGFAVMQAALPEARAEWRLGLARVGLRSDDPWLTVKSSNRAGYDVARAQMAAGLDEVILLNERGEVCDGSITTLFFDRGHGMRTPPLSCGLLPGVLRAEMACEEEVLLAEDLPRVALWVGNSLRGLIPARWVI